MHLLQNIYTLRQISMKIQSNNSSKNYYHLAVFWLTFYLNFYVFCIWKPEMFRRNLLHHNTEESNFTRNESLKLKIYVTCNLDLYSDNKWTAIVQKKSLLYSTIECLNSDLKGIHGFYFRVFFHIRRIYNDLRNCV